MLVVVVVNVLVLIAPLVGMQISLQIAGDSLAHDLLVVQMLMLIISKLLTIVKHLTTVLVNHAAIVDIVIKVISIHEVKISKILEIVNVFVIIQIVIGIVAGVIV